MIGGERRQFIRDIKFGYHGSRARNAFELLGECAILKKLHIVITKWTTTGSKKPQTDLWKSRGISALRAIRDLKFLDVVVEQQPIRRYIPQPTWGLHLQLSQEVEANFFDDGHVLEFQTLLQKEMRQDSHRTEEELEKERKRIERKEKEEKEQQRWRLQHQREWKDFEEKEAKRLAKLASGSGLR